ncbi:SRPBCC family protein [Actinoplanes sp. NPDC051633]|uniref:SRPBCC family protein n=1 Tax=Actinoplanes sp. NPDC051633 TaxID=3155670 RepID=UPI0034409EF1
MPVVEASVVVPLTPDVAFAVSQTTAPVRYRWDPFVRRQHFVDGATRPGKGVRTFTRQRFGFSMVSEYVSFHPPTNVGMKMVRGPWFFSMFAGGWRFAPAPDRPQHSIATWRYSFRCRPAVVRPIAEWIGERFLDWEIRRRIAGYARGCVDPVVLAAARQALEDGPASG